MPSSEVRYQRGDVYRHYDEDILRARRSSSSTSSLRAKKHFGSVTSAENAAVQRHINQQRLNEEYLTKKKVEVKTTKNTERRVQRCIVLEDGRIIEHDDPHIVVDTIEDTQTHEFDHLEDESLAKELQASIEQSYRNAGIPLKSKSRRKSLAYCGADKLISNQRKQSDSSAAGSIVNDTFTRTVNTHDVKENVVRTHAAKDLGSISTRGLRKVLKKQGKVSDYIRYDDYHRGKDHHHKVKKYEKESHKRVVDTEDVHQLSRRLGNGQIRSETFRTETHEVFDDKKAPDDQPSGSSETEHEKDEQRFTLTKTKDATDYYDSRGKLLMKGQQLTARDMHIVGPKEKWVEIDDDRVRQVRNSVKKRLKPSEDAERKDALTKKPLDLDKEERTRKKETDKWLERHFGSDWSLASANKFKYLKGGDFDASAVRRTMSFSSIPIQYTNPGEKVSRVIKQTTTTIRPGFDKHVVSTVTKSMVPNAFDTENEERRHRSLDSRRPYHSTLTLNTPGPQRPLEARKHHASAVSLHEQSRQVPIDQEVRPRSRVQRLIDEQRSQHSSKSSHRHHNHHRRSYYYGEDPRVQSEPPRPRTLKPQAEVKRNQAVPLYRTELLKTSNKMYDTGIQNTPNSSRPQRSHWRDELSKSYHDISIPLSFSSKEKYEKTQSYNELPKMMPPSQLFGWSDELHGYHHARAGERSEGIKNIKRSKSFATASPSDRSSTSEASYNILQGYQRKTKSYKDTKVSKGQKENCTADVFEFERKIPMQSSILEAQKFKTVIFVSGN